MCVSNLTDTITYSKVTNYYCSETFRRFMLAFQLLLFYFSIRYLIFQSGFKFTANLRRKCRDFPYAPSSHITAWPIINTPHQSGTLGAMINLTSIHHYHPKAIVYNTLGFTIIFIRRKMAVLPFALLLFSISLMMLGLEITLIHFIFVLIPV
jgi:hypothetical protein